LIPYGAATLLWGPLSDRIGRARVILGSMTAFVTLTAATTVAGSASWFIVTTVSANRGQAMGLNVFTLFVGFGLGSLVFQAALNAGFPTALIGFATVALIAAAAAVPAFTAEVPAQLHHAATESPAALQHDLGDQSTDR
jgi:MFS family permease